VLALLMHERNSRRRRFAVAAIAAALAAAVFLAWMRVRLGGDTVTVAAMDVGETLAALAAAVTCAWAARQSGGRLRRAWTFLALSAAAWGLGQIFWTVFEVGFGSPATSPSGADVGYLAAIPLAIAGVLSFPTAPTSRVHRYRALMDGAIVAGALVFVAWALGLQDVYLKSSLGGLGRVVATVYPAGDILVVTLLVLVMRRAGGGLQVAVMLLLLGYLANLAADALYTYTTLGGTYGTLGSFFDTGWVFGYLLVALAALWPAGGERGEPADSPVEPWQLAMPWLGVFALMLVAVWAAATDHTLDFAGTLVAAGVGFLFVSSQAMLLVDSVRLINASRRAETRLQERTTLLNQVISRAPLGIARIDMNMRFLDANPRLCALLSAPASVIVNSRVLDYLPPDQLAVVVDRFSALLDGSVESIEGESRVRRADGTDTWLRWSGTTVRHVSGKIEYFLAMFEDFAAKHEVEQQAAANLANSETLNRLKSEFMSMVSHEFRTALTGIQGYSELMAMQEVTPEEVKEFSGDINADALRLNRMITEMLDLDRIESGRISLTLARLDLNRVLCDAADRARVTTTKHAIVTDLDPRVPPLDGDGDRLTQVVANLLSNAIKYSPDGGEILVSSRLADGEVTVSVKDRGPGIPPEFRTKIFGRYARYEGAGKAQVVGTGLGLAIAQQIIQMHKGRIWVESTVGEGSVFSFTLPVASSPALAQVQLPVMSAAIAAGGTQP
ncbi:MAG TPA: ATP-binding protein, partial [Candidatus Sulfotelmatobacter sp.]|nr:ATP-binding protein [Candidatus Sulfotelmatobacter sp.]